MLKLQPLSLILFNFFIIPHLCSVHMLCCLFLWETLKATTALCATAAAHLQPAAISQPTSCRGSILITHILFFLSVLYRTARMIILKCKSDDISIIYQSYQSPFLNSSSLQVVQNPSSFLWLTDTVGLVSSLCSNWSFSLLFLHLTLATVAYWLFFECLWPIPTLGTLQILYLLFAKLIPRSLHSSFNLDAPNLWWSRSMLQCWRTYWGAVCLCICACLSVCLLY